MPVCDYTNQFATPQLSAMSDEGLVVESILHAARRLGYHDLREHQLDAAKKFLQGNDVFVSLPTGSGKSLIYAVLPFAFDHLRGSEGSIVVVVSPLLSLMKDQVRDINCI